MDATNDPPTLPESRSYHLAMFRESLTRNTIISMGTVTGKTHVAILRMKHEAEHEPKKVRLLNYCFHFILLIGFVDLVVSCTNCLPM